MIEGHLAKNANMTWVWIRQSDSGPPTPGFLPFYDNSQQLLITKGKNDISTSTASIWMKQRPLHLELNDQSSRTPEL